MRCKGPAPSLSSRARFIDLDRGPTCNIYCTLQEERKTKKSNSWKKVCSISSLVVSIKRDIQERQKQKYFGQLSANTEIGPDDFIGILRRPHVTFLMALFCKQILFAKSSLTANSGSDAGKKKGALGAGIKGLFHKLPILLFSFSSRKDLMKLDSC